MKKILFITLLLLITLTISACNNISNIPIAMEATALTPPISYTFRSVDELVDWIENYDHCCFESFLSLARQRDSIITIDEISSEFELTRLSVQDNRNSMVYHFENGDDLIHIVIFLTGVRGANQPLAQEVENFVIELQEPVPIHNTQIESMQYTAFVEGFQSASLERIPLEITNLYYIRYSDSDTPVVFFEIEGMQIQVSFSIRNLDSPLASLFDGWDNSYLDMFQFTSRPINVGSRPNRPMEPITPPIGVPDVTLNGVHIEFDVDPIIVNDRTMVPFRAIFEALDMRVEWDNYARRATGTRGFFRIEIQIDNDIAFVNADIVDLDVPAMIYNDRTMVPLRFIAEASGANVEWDEDTQTVLISTD